MVYDDDDKCDAAVLKRKKDLIKRAKADEAWEPPVKFDVRAPFDTSTAPKPGEVEMIEFDYDKSRKTPHKAKEKFDEYFVLTLGYDVYDMVIHETRSDKSFHMMYGEGSDASSDEVDEDEEFGEVGEQEDDEELILNEELGFGKRDRVGAREGEYVDRKLLISQVELFALFTRHRHALLRWLRRSPGRHNRVLEHVVRVVTFPDRGKAASLLFISAANAPKANATPLSANNPLGQQQSSTTNSGGGGGGASSSSTGSPSPNAAGGEGDASKGVTLPAPREWVEIPVSGFNGRFVPKPELPYWQARALGKEKEGRQIMKKLKEGMKNITSRKDDAHDRRGEGGGKRPHEVCAAWVRRLMTAETGTEVNIQLGRLTTRQNRMAVLPQAAAKNEDFVEAMCTTKRKAKNSMVDDKKKAFDDRPVWRSRGRRGDCSCSLWGAITM